LQRAGLRADFASFGDPFLLPQTFQSVSLAEVKRTFGDQFASAISTASLGVWQGPVASGYGAHLIFVTQRSDGHTPALADVREQVRREWLDAKRREATDKFYEALLRRYTIRIEPPEEKKVAQVH
jgi:parvulin-like peptidyl-prolyl isomerase